MSILRPLLLAGLTFSVSIAQDNPIKVAGAEFMGRRESTNTQSIRDLGWMGKIGDTWITTFGDSVGCTNAGLKQGCSCAYITARDSAGIVEDDPLKYADVNVRDDLCDGTPQVATFCGKLPGEEESAGYGLTNIVGVNSTHGVLVARPTFNNGEIKNLGYALTATNSPGAGLAVVDISNGKPVCSRPFGISSWDATEPDWGQHSLMLDQGLIYVYAAGPNDLGPVVARVPQEEAFDVDSYEYYHGMSFTSDRIYNKDLHAGSAEILAGNWKDAKLNQGSVFYSKYYKKYLMLQTFPAAYVIARSAQDPWGPWTDPVTLFEAPNVVSLIYAPAVMDKFTSDDGKSILISYTNDNELNVMNVTFV